MEVEIVYTVRGKYGRFMVILGTYETGINSSRYFE
jgi:hypothetical protein